jgi:asparagine synthase (glutamine-hydrolysing)
VPFLDHRLVELTLRIPPSLYPELFWDKAILRRAMAPELPEALWRREKVPFFFGEDERYSRRLVYELLRTENDRLLHEGLEGSRMAGGAIDEACFWRLVEDLPNDPEYGNVDAILELVNMGLLQAMAREAPKLDKASPSLPEVRIDDWEAFRREHGESFVARHRDLSLESVPRFAEGVLLARCEGGDPDWRDEGGYYVIVNNELRFVIAAEEEDWIRFLCGVDGKRSVSSLLDDGGLRRERVWKHLEEAIELGVIGV